MKTQFQIELEKLLNSYSVENESDTPDFILAEYLLDCLETWNKAVIKRDKWYGYEAKEAFDLGAKCSRGAE